MMERWQQIQSLLKGALERDPAERNAWLREACRGDAELQREVSSLLANHLSAADSQPWAAAAKLIDNSASLEPGQCLGPYRIAPGCGSREFDLRAFDYSATGLPIQHLARAVAEGSGD